MAIRILIVEDDREVSYILRAAVRLLDSNFEVVDKPSAEEAMLEAQRGGFDLVIADVRLPGIDGLEMMRRLRRSRPDAQVIVITGTSTPDIGAQARALNAVALFEKPINIDELAAAVLQALGQSQRGRAGAAVPLLLMPNLAERLSDLRRDLGCLAVYLGDLDGHVVARAGDVASFDIDQLLGHAEVAFSASLQASHLLGGLVSQNIFFFDGDEYDVYLVNVGQTYMLVMLFSGDIGARQMGQVLRYGRQCADDMLNAIADLLNSQSAGDAGPAGRPAQTPAPAPAPAGKPAPAPEPLPALHDEKLDAAARKLNQQDLDAFWTDAATQVKAVESSGNALTFEQARKLGLVDNQTKE
ncbi:MAG: response regulator [Chloroflexi bacterium]|nr:response regulator [Chloroflexota bacterium]